MKHKIQKAWQVFRFYRYNLIDVLRFVKINFLSKHVHRYNGYFFPYPNLEILWKEGAVVEIYDTLRIGIPINSKSKVKSRMIMGKNSRFKVDSKTEIMEGCDLQLLDNATLSVSKLHSNICLEVLCGCQIRMQGEVTLGRHVRIRDYNGHETTSKFYPKTNPVIIENHVWICTGATVNAGSYISNGCIIGDNASVWGHIPEASFVIGNPAKIKDTNIKFKI
mgnify:CR=1 FL=1